jgi:hypothetical protein
MAKELKLGFAPFRAPSKGILIVFCDDTLKVGLDRDQAVAFNKPDIAAKRGAIHD